MTIFDWMKASTRYDFEDITFEAIAIDREITVTQDVTTLSVRDKELLKADMIFIAVTLSPSNISSKSVSHNGFKKSTGNETDSNRTQKINYALSIYKLYDEEKYNILNNAIGKIKFIKIEDERW